MISYNLAVFLAVIVGMANCESEPECYKIEQTPDGAREEVPEGAIMVSGGNGKLYWVPLVENIDE